MEETSDAPEEFVDIDTLEDGLGHAGELAKASDNGLEVGDLGEKRGRAFLEDFFEHLRAVFARADEVFDGELKREERVLELVGEAAGEFAPGGDALSLNQAFFLFEQVGGHAIEGLGEVADFVGGSDVYVGVEIAGCDLVSGE